MTRRLIIAALTLAAIVIATNIAGIAVMRGDA